MYVMDPMSCLLPMVLGGRHQQVLRTRLKPAVPHMSCGASGMKNKREGLGPMLRLEDFEGIKTLPTKFQPHLTPEG
jgi:hypothetical protein